MFKENIRDEELYILSGKRIGCFWYGKISHYQLGHPHQVAFDYNYVLENQNKVVGWIHTHPVNKARPSATDHQTMTAWNLSLGKPLVCCIKGTDGLRAWWYFDDESPGVEGKVYRLGKDRLFGIVPSI